MIRDEHIDAAVAQGIITPEQASRLQALTRPQSPGASAEAAPDPDDERFRLIGGFNDVFVTIGVGLLIAALFGLARVLEFTSGFSVLALVSAWGLSEVFSRRMRLALPSIVLAFMFAGAAAILGGSLADSTLAAAGIASDAAASWAVIAGAVSAAAAAVLHERRFQVPIDTALAAGSAICATILALLAVFPAWAETLTTPLTALFGFAVFAAALRIDATDPARVTRRSDVAFWLHMLAAPMIVRSVMPLATGGGTEIDALRAVFILAVFSLLGLVALVIDRRALLVSGLTYAGIAIAYLLSQSVNQEGLGLSLTLLSLAALVLALSAGWRSLRRTIVPRLPLGGLLSHVPPPT
jgi:hypothetical protein